VPSAAPKILYAHASPTLEAGVLVLLISALRDSPYRPPNPNDVFQVCFAKSRGALLASCPR
jgi:hypothetical protein